jgi:thioredoxin 1
MEQIELIVDQYSAVWIGGAFVLLVALVLFQGRPQARDFIALGVVIAGLAAAWLLLHPRQTSLLGDAKKVQSMIGAGVPVLLEFQSPFCIHCTQMKPVVDRLENELGERLRVIRLNAQDEIGRNLAPVYMLEYTPTFVLFDSQGNELLRQTGDLDTERVKDLIEE